ncbi:hypothetical protein PthBH41_04490 [Parageobacillus thermoglucosidasius]|nr:hypothetical protein PthBH41_04490 [Parageobacillus thermoglucosidasius]GAJ43855.1 hypothetical protein GT2_13_00330 [Parageobacillus thermoglucosidasius NBRC 107763]
MYNKVWGIHSGGTSDGDYGFMIRMDDVINPYSSPDNPFTLYYSSTNVLVAN